MREPKAYDSYDLSAATILPATIDGYILYANIEDK